MTPDLFELTFLNFQPVPAPGSEGSADQMERKPDPLKYHRGSSGRFWPDLQVIYPHSHTRTRTRTSGSFRSPALPQRRVHLHGNGSALVLADSEAENSSGQNTWGRLGVMLLTSEVLGLVQTNRTGKFSRTCWV